MNDGGVVEWPVHPVAALFPLLPEDELADLAADIKANGLMHPVVLGDWTDDGQSLHGVIDGRNRLLACALARVEPRFIELDPGVNQRAYIISSNASRRHMSTGQLAMTLALARTIAPDEVLAEPLKVGLGRPRKHAQSQAEDARVAGIPQQRISDAELVIDWAPEMVDEVLEGGDAEKRCLAAL